jgi:ribosomal protein S18 acetylase RimI-like enzyme
MMDWTIRQAGPADAAAILAADVFDGPAIAAATRHFLGPGTAPDPRTLLFLAEVAGRIEGFVSAILTDHPDKPRALYLIELGVNEGFRRQGIARALIVAARAAGRARGATETWVLTEGDNSDARALYRAAGGTETPDVVMYAWDETGRD